MPNRDMKSGERERIVWVASRDIHVSLDSSTPCWNNTIERALLEVTEVLLPRIYKQAIKFWGDIFADLPHRTPRFLTV
jgi:hypothetical protein